MKIFFVFEKETGINVTSDYDWVLTIDGKLMYYVEDLDIWFGTREQDYEYKLANELRGD